jgi:hypothetical protein
MATDWHVTYQEERPSFRPNGSEAKVVDVHYVIDTDPGQGYNGVVSIEDANYDPAKIGAMIQDQVSRRKATHAL